MLQRHSRVVGLNEPCLPSPAKAPPSGADWLHEIKHDGFRILARRRVGSVPLVTVAAKTRCYGSFTWRRRALRENRPLREPPF